jgi:hypothetical protein
MQVAGLTMSARLANAIYRDGQQATRLNELNGLDEALNDGSNNGFQGTSFSSYLTVPRTSVDSALNSPMTGPTADVSGALSYPTLEQAYQSVCIGAEKPDLMLTTNLGYGYIKMIFQPQQRFEEVDPNYGFVTQGDSGMLIRWLSGFPKKGSTAESLMARTILANSSGGPLAIVLFRSTDSGGRRSVRGSGTTRLQPQH